MKTMFLFASKILFANPLEPTPNLGKDTWMGTLSLSVFPDGASFLLQGYVSQETWIPLPGETGTWPYLVQEEEDNLLIIEKEGIPHTLLTKGNHSISGMFSWIDVPTQVRVPPSVGMVYIEKTQNPFPFFAETIECGCHPIQATPSNNRRNESRLNESLRIKKRTFISRFKAQKHKTSWNISFLFWMVMPLSTSKQKVPIGTKKTNYSSIPLKEENTPFY